MRDDRPFSDSDAKDAALKSTECDTQQENLLVSRKLAHRTAGRVRPTGGLSECIRVLALLFLSTWPTKFHRQSKKR
jgi:hypothetical protein